MKMIARFAKCSNNIPGIVSNIDHRLRNPKLIIVYVGPVSASTGD
jgi:hypothetical protein